MVEPVTKKEILQEIDDIKSSLPEHSIPPSMLLRLEELEEIIWRTD